MQKSDLPRFMALIGALAETFQKSPSEATFLGYEMALDDLPIERIEIAVRKAMRSCKFMPLGVELRELAGELSTTDRPRLAWDEFERAVVSVGGYKSPDFADPLINAVVRHLGGWVRCCDMPAEEFDVWLKKEFLAAYASYMRATPSPEACGPLVGISEAHNRIVAPSHPVPLVGIGTDLPALPNVGKAPPRINRGGDAPRVEFKQL